MSLAKPVEYLRATVGPYLQNGVFIFFIIASSQIVDNINVTGFISGVDDVQKQFNISYSLASWTLSAYAVTYASFILLFGRISDIVGHHVVLTVGLFCLCIFSIVAAAVENIYVLIIFRALQGVCAAATVPPSFGIIAHSFTGRALNIALSSLSTILVVSFGLGLIIGGGLSLTPIGYRAICWLTAGCSLLFSVLALIAIKPVNGSNSSGSLKRLDYFGVFLLVSGGLLMVTGFTEAGESWRKSRAYVPIVIGLLLIGAFCCWEILFFKNGRGSSIDLMIPKVMWTVKNFKIIPLITFFLYAGCMSELIVLIQYFDNIYDDSAVISGVRILPMVVVMCITTATLSLIPFGKYSPKWLCFIGSVAGFVGVLIINRMKYAPNSYWRYCFPGLIFFAFGTNLYFVNYLNMIILATPMEMQALVSGICLTTGQYGVAIGLAAVTSIIGNSNIEISDKKELSEVYINAFYLPVATYAACAVLVLFFVKDLKPEDNKHGTQPEENGTVVEEEKDEDKLELESGNSTANNTPHTSSSSTSEIPELVHNV